MICFHARSFLCAGPLLWRMCFFAAWWLVCLCLHSQSSPSTTLVAASISVTATTHVAASITSVAAGAASISSFPCPILFLCVWVAGRRCHPWWEGIVKASWVS